MVIYPPWSDAPDALREIDWNCGLISVWLTLRSLGVSCDEQSILKICNFREGEPTYLICVAVGLHDLGLKVEFRTDPDPDLQRDERICCEEAKKRRMTFSPALPIQELLETEANGARVILFFEGEGGDGHISPVSHFDERNVRLVYDNPAFIPVKELERRRKYPGICRQSLAVFAK
jgi:hypothetical protein